MTLSGRDDPRASVAAREVLRPMLFNRFLASLPPVALVLLGDPIAALGSHRLSVALQALLCAAIPVLMIRGYRMVVILKPGSFQVRGRFYNRTITIDEFERITAFRVVRWRTSRGRRRRTPIMAFMSSGGNVPAIGFYNDEMIDRITDWVTQERVAQSSTTAPETRPISTN